MMRPAYGKQSGDRDKNTGDTAMMNKDRSVASFIDCDCVYTGQGVVSSTRFSGLLPTRGVILLSLQGLKWRVARVKERRACQKMWDARPWVDISGRSGPRQGPRRRAGTCTQLAPANHTPSYPAAAETRQLHQSIPHHQPHNGASNSRTRLKSTTRKVRAVIFAECECPSHNKNSGCEPVPGGVASR